MEASQFKHYWNSSYPETPVIPYFLKFAYIDRWFRIHSLPNPKRYSESEEDLNILLGRQNAILTDLFGQNEKVVFVTGDFYMEGEKEMFPISAVQSIKTLEFVPLDFIDLHRFDPENYDKGQVFRPLLSELIWKNGKHNQILIDIAEDRLKGFFVSFEKNYIAAPYDGGVDFVLPDSEIRDNYKKKYREWLSERADGL